MAYTLNDPLEPQVWTEISTVSGTFQNVSKVDIRVIESATLPTSVNGSSLLMPGDGGTFTASGTQLYALNESSVIKAGFTFIPG